MTIREIERQIKRLPRPRLAAFRAWFQRFDSVAWDRQFEDDVRAKKLDGFAKKAIASYKTGLAKEF